MPADPYAPFTAGSREPEPPPPDASGVRGRMSGPAEVPPGRLDYFTDPAFSETGNDGRLYYEVFTGIREDGTGWSHAYVVWRPAGAAEDLKQRMKAAAGYYITPGDIATDGKELLVTLRPSGKNKGKKLRLERYRWEGDALGNGRWVHGGLVRMLPAG